MVTYRVSLLTTPLPDRGLRSAAPVPLSAAADVEPPARTASRAARMQAQTEQHEWEQITRQVHDEAIRELFAISLSLESARTLVAHRPDRVEGRLAAAVDSLDDIARELRSHGSRLRPGASAGVA